MRHLYLIKKRSDKNIDLSKELTLSKLCLWALGYLHELCKHVNGPQEGYKRPASISMILSLAQLPWLSKQKVTKLNELI